jgi:16S rRNA (guanine527-N7)-methyltransferase
VTAARFDDQFVKDAGSLGVVCEPQMLVQLDKYLDELLKWNHHFNLLGMTEVEGIKSKHILDCLAVSPFLTGETILDVGTGAGLPGIPLAILNPSKHFFLLDSNGKKTRFLFQVKVALGLENVTVENSRIENYQSTRQIDIVMSRAFASLRDMVGLSQHLLPEQGQWIAMKGRYPEQEIAELPSSAQVIGTEKLSIPGEDGERHLIRLKRI